MSDFAHDMTLTVEEQERLNAVYASLDAARRPAPAVADATLRQRIAYRLVNVCRRLGVTL